jgi:hypothetical protein
MNASYVYQNSRGLIGTDFNDSYTLAGYFNNPNDHENSVGRFPYERRHQLKLQALVKGPWSINLSGYFRWLAGRRYTREVRSGDLGVTLNQGPETIYAEKRGSQGYPDLYILDLRVEKAFNLGSITLSMFVDIFNIFNAGKATEVYTISSNSAIPFGDIETIQDPRIFRLGAKIEF